VYFSVQETGEKKELNTPGGGELMTRFGAVDAGLPYFAFLDAKGEPIVNSLRPGKNGKGENIGHPEEPEEVDWFMSMLAKAVPRMTSEERATLEKYLRAQKK
jgi:hypothetical protein